MKRMYASGRLSNGVLATGLALAIPMHAMTASARPQLETNSPQTTTTIEEWHWRDMAF
ncbi:hypothetical protein [Leptolyngbya sp. Heron Island J]|uniref:hypothetical protein n=1 Tax=Leptolyngbya sp. Heron Island J TaxID=1385935 RepID=UPI000425D27C|nr:hypothetical protein [Leptolyngbya sp. Heron Island J]